MRFFITDNFFFLFFLTRNRLALNSSMLNFDEEGNVLLLFIALAMVVEEKGVDVVIGAVVEATTLFDFFSLSLLGTAIVGCFLNSMRSNKVTPLVDGAGALIFFVVKPVVPPAPAVTPAAPFPTAGLTLVLGIGIAVAFCFAVGLLADFVSCFAGIRCCCC